MTNRWLNCMVKVNRTTSTVLRRVALSKYPPTDKDRRTISRLFVAYERCRRKFAGG